MFKVYLYLLSNSPGALTKPFTANMRARTNHYPSNIEIIQLGFQGPCSLLKQLAAVVQWQQMWQDKWDAT